MKLWPQWLDRMYWRRYLKRHPYHLASPTMQFVWRRCQRDLLQAMSAQCEEWSYVEDAK